MRHLALCTSLAAALMAGPAFAQTASTLTEQLAAGQPFVVVAKKDAITLRAGDWSYPSGSDYWVAFEGRYAPDSGIWSSDGLGFTPRNNEFQACPPDLDRSRFICGGAHSTGYRMSSRLTPENHGLVILGHELTFDNAGKVYKDGVEIGVITVPPAPY